MLPKRNPRKTRETANAKREELARLVKDSTDKNRQFFAIYLGLWVYVLLMVFATTDQMLLVPTQGIKLPLVDVTLPLLGFYIVAPLFLLVIHFNLLQNLESHHYKLMRWRDSYNDRIPREVIHAFLFDFEWLERGSRMEWLVRFGSRILCLHSGPLALGILLWRFTDYQDIWITTWHLLAFSLDSYLVWQAESAFRKNCAPLQPPFDWPAFFSRLMARCFGVLVFLQFGVACWFQSDYFLYGWRHFTNNKMERMENVKEWVRRASPSLSSLLVPIIFIDPNESIWLPDVKEIEAQALLVGEEKTVQWWQSSGKGLNLAGRHLRGFSAKDAISPKLDLRDSFLEGADFSNAIMVGAELTGAQMQEAVLDNAKLQGANLFRSKLQGARLENAQLQGANLVKAQLQGASLTGVQLQGALLDGAELQGADLVDAQLQGADLLGDTILQGADLRRAQFQGADLSEAELQGIIVGHTAFLGALLPSQKPSQYAYLNPLKIYREDKIISVYRVVRFPLLNQVVYNGTPFSMSKPDWAAIKKMAKEIPDKNQRELFYHRIQKAIVRKPQTEETLRQSLFNQPDVIWKEIIPLWDSEASVGIWYAVRHVRNSWLQIKRDEKNDSLLFTPGDYAYEVNLAFCNSNRLKSMCELQQRAVPPPKATITVPASSPAAH